jgi:peptidoglycan/LPS O-acetylase OafA/YrhL
VRFDGFDLIRIVAALLVVFDHSFGITGHRPPHLSVGTYQLDTGHLGVIIFFLTSGFLVAQSWEHDPRALRFGQRRFARIWPALAVLVILSVFVLGPLVTELSVSQYFGTKFSWDYLWNMTLFARVHFRLPGVFDGQPAQAVNGSLWTLPYEAFAYVGVAVLGVVGILRRRALVAGIAAVTLLVFELAVVERSLPAPYAVLGITERSAIHLGTYFLLGVALSAYRDQLQKRWLMLGGAGLCALAFPVGEPLFFVVGISAFVIGLGMTSSDPVERFHRFGDPSYGIYILSFPAQQILVYLGYSPDPIWFFALAAPVSVALGYLSWWVVERPSMRLLRPRQQQERLAEPSP